MRTKAQTLLKRLAGTVALAAARPVRGLALLSGSTQAMLPKEAPVVLTV
jgi:hypothetical protein